MSKYTAATARLLATELLPDTISANYLRRAGSVVYATQGSRRFPTGCDPTACQPWQKNTRELVFLSRETLKTLHVGTAHCLDPRLDLGGQVGGLKRGQLAQ